MKRASVFVFLLISAMLILISSTQFTSTKAQSNTSTNSQGLMAWWKLDEGKGTTAIDSSGNNFTSVIHGATWVNDQTQSVLSFNGKTDYVALPKLPLTTVNALTTVAWVNSDFTQVGYVLSFGDGGTFELANGVIVNGQGPPLNISQARFAVKLSDSSWWTAWSPSSLQPGSHQFAGVWTNGVSLKIYIDGVLADQEVVPAEGLFDSGPGWPPCIGTYAQGNWGIPTYVKGQMSNVMIYNRALTTQEVQELYTQSEQPVANFTYSPTIATVRQSLLFNGSLSKPNLNGTAITSYQWNFGDGNTSTTNESTISHTFASQNAYNVTLTVFDNSGRNASASQIVPVKMSTFVSVSTVSSTTIGSAIDITGNLTDAEGNAIPNETVVISYTFAGANSWLPITSEVTDQKGVYDVEWLNTATGAFTIMVQWQGNVTFLGANGTVELSSLPYQNHYVFLVESNSTVSSLAFDSTTSQLGFTVSGPSGTFGYVKVTIVKTIINDVSSISAYLDGSQVPFSVSSTSDSWILTLNYHQSTHSIEISLPTRNVAQQSPQAPSASSAPSPSVPEFPAWTILPLAITAALTIVTLKWKDTVYRVKKSLQTNHDKNSL